MLKFGIIGTGAIAFHHAKSIEELENCELVAVCSSTRERAEAAAQKFGVPGYYDYETMFNTHQIDIVCICTASGQHLEPALAAARHGVHVLTEKPLEVSLERADIMINAFRKAGLKLGCIFQNRFKPEYLLLKEAVINRYLGGLICGNAYIKWFRDEKYYSSSEWKGTLEGDGGAALINQGIHTIDLLLDIMGDVASVFGKVRTVKHQIEGEDLGIGLISFKNGALGTIEGSTALWPGYPERLEVFGTLGSVVLEGGKITAWNVPVMELPALLPDQVGDKSSSDPMALPYNFHKQQIQDMVDAVVLDKEPAVNGEAARKPLELVLAIYQSSKTGKEIFL